MNSPLGMLNFTNAATGDMECVEVTEIRRITDFRSAGENDPHSRVWFKDGTWIDSGNTGHFLRNAYHEIIRGTLPRLDAVERID